MKFVGFIEKAASGTGRFLILNPVGCFASGLILGILASKSAGVAVLWWIAGMIIPTLLATVYWRDENIIGKRLTVGIYALVCGAILHCWQFSSGFTDSELQQFKEIKGEILRDWVSDPHEPRSALLKWKHRLRPVSGSVVRVKLPGNVPLMKPGTRAEFAGFFEAPKTARNPGERPQRLADLRVQGNFKVVVPEAVTILAVPDGLPLREHLKLASLAARAWTAEALSRGLEAAPERLAIVKAMVLGMGEEAADEDREAFELSGTMHLFAVSGLHIMIFSLVATGLLRGMPVRYLPVAVGTILAAFLYAFVTGWPASAVRAAVMISILQVGIVIGRGSQRFNSLGLAALAILLVDTGQLFEVGFQLSFLVLGAITFLAGPFSSWWRGLLMPDPFIPRRLYTTFWQKKRIVAGLEVSSMLGVSCAAWAGSVIPIWIYFRIVTPVTVLANLVMIPCAYLVIALATLSVFTTLAGAPKLAAGANRANGFVVNAVTEIARKFSQLPAAYYRNTGIGRTERSVLKTTVFEAGFGGGAQVIDPPGAGNTWVLDCGDAYFARTTVTPFLRGERESTITGLILSHADSRHIGGAKGLARAWEPAVIAMPAWFKSRPSASLREVMEKNFVRPLNSGETLSLDSKGQAILEILHPPQGMTHGIADDNCLVARLHFEGWSVLFANDAGFDTEYLLSHSGFDLRSDVLVTGKHATDHSATYAFLKAVSPRILIATNSNYPRAQTRSAGWTSALDEKQSAIMLHSTHGAVTLEITEKRLKATGFASGETVTLRH